MGALSGCGFCERLNGCTGVDVQRVKSYTSGSAGTSSTLQ